MKIIAKVNSSEFLVHCSATELAKIIGKEGHISESEGDKIFHVGTTIGFADTFSGYQQIVNAPDRVSKLAQQLREEADRVEKVSASYSRILTPPVKAAK